MTAAKEFKQHNWTSCRSRRRNVWGQGVAEDLFLIFSLCWILGPLLKVSKNSLDTNRCFALEKK